MAGQRARRNPGGWRWSEVFPVLASAVLLPGCGHIVMERSSYTGATGVEINGALVRSAVMPTGGEENISVSAVIYTAGSGTLDGPFLWRIEAKGDDGYHKTLTVHRLKVETKVTERSEWYPEDLLGKTVEFVPLKGEEGEVFAQYQIPGKLEVFPSQDGAITISVDLTVRSVEREVREVVRFRMAPEQTKDIELLFLPADVAKGSREGDPRSWKW